MDGKKDQDVLNHKLKDLDEIRNSKYLACMQPITIPTSLGDITNQWCHSFLMSLWIFLYTTQQTTTVIELERTGKVKTIFKYCINSFWGPFSLKRLWFWNQQCCRTAALKGHLPGIRRTESSPSFAVVHPGRERQTSLSFFCISFVTFKIIYFNSININWVPTVCQALPSRESRNECDTVPILEEGQGDGECFHFWGPVES